MAQSRRQLTPFNLSFLDIMSCGFGAAILLFLIIKHNIDTDTSITVNTPDLASEVSLLEEEILVGEKDLAKLKSAIEEIEHQLITTQTQARHISAEMNAVDRIVDELLENAGNDQLDKLKAELKKLEQQKQTLQKQLDQSGDDAREFSGEGDRAYVTGLKLGGKRLLILIDSSASMLDATIVNIIRRRNMSDDKKRNAPKWTHAVRIVEWLSAKFPLDSQFQIYSFNTDTNALLSNTKGQWLDVSDKDKLNAAISSLKMLVPADGTNLQQVFNAANQLNPKPDNIYLITDGLPTRNSRAARNTTISGKERLKLFSEAIDKLPQRTPLNVILIPLEGDPYAPIAYWRLARATQGSFMSPSYDWP
ncbi:MAG: VWA domain-containing protein [Proteobacteria bacterium]|nr:VWA domain-containing protein [Pseudomonadota bacterium]